jgi:hypothetical protein
MISVFTKVGTPTLQKELSMGFDHFPNFAQLVRREAVIIRQFDQWVDPELRLAPFPFNMHMGRLSVFARPEIESVWTDAEGCRHSPRLPHVRISVVIHIAIKPSISAQYTTFYHTRNALTRESIGLKKPAAI